MAAPPTSVYVRTSGSSSAETLTSLLHPTATVILLVLSLPAVVACAVRSFHWPFIHDAPLMHYIVWRILSGAVPYRDVFDMNMPGTYLVHWIALRGFGISDPGFRLFDFLWLALTSSALYLFCRPFSRWAGALSAVFFFSFHLSQGALSMGQRDFLLCVFLILGAHFLAGSVEVGGSLKLSFLAGLALGFGATIKPYAAIYASFMLALLVGILLHQPRSGWKSNAALFLTGTAVWPALFVAWLAFAGGLQPLVEIVWGYLLPYYAKLGGTNPFTLAIQLIKPNVFWILVAAVPWDRSERRPRYTLALLGALYGILHYTLQGKDWWYHKYPFQAFLFILIAMSLSDLLARSNAKSRLCGVLCLLLCQYALAAACYRTFLQPMSGTEVVNKKRVIESLAAYLKPRVDPRRDTVQTMDTAAGGVATLLLLQVREATRFMYDFELLNLVNDPFVRELQSEFMEQIRAHPPKYVVVFKWSGPPPSGYRRFLAFPAFCRWLGDFYVEDFSQPDYEVFKRKPAGEQTARSSVASSWLPAARQALEGH
jgi:hypothetical protein